MSYIGMAAVTAIIALAVLAAALATTARRHTPDGHALVRGTNGHLHYISGLPRDTHHVHATDVCWCRNHTDAREDEYPT